MPFCMLNTARAGCHSAGGFAMPAGGGAAGANTRDDLKAGWLEKRTGEGSNLAALPVNSWKWQRRWGGPVAEYASVKCDDSEELMGDASLLARGWGLCTCHCEPF